MQRAIPVWIRDGAQDFKQALPVFGDGSVSASSTTVATSLYTLLSVSLVPSLHRTAHFCHPSKHSVPSPINKVSVKCIRLTISSSGRAELFWNIGILGLSQLFVVKPL